MAADGKHCRVWPKVQTLEALAVFFREAERTITATDRQEGELVELHYVVFVH